MKIHFGLFEDCGSGEDPLSCCVKTLCGCHGEWSCENAVDDWDQVSCKKCLKLKKPYKIGCKLDEKIIVEQMGEMAECFNDNY